MTEEDNNSLRLRVSVGDTSIEVAGQTEEVETWFEALRSDYLPPQKSTIESEDNGDEEVESDGRKDKTLAELYKAANDPNKSETALLVGWYLEEYENQNDFTAGEVNECAKTYKVPVGENVARDLRNQVGNGYLDQVGERNGSSTYHLTLPGEEYVQEELGIK